MRRIFAAAVLALTCCGAARAAEGDRHVRLAMYMAAPVTAEEMKQMPADFWARLKKQGYTIHPLEIDTPVVPMVGYFTKIDKHVFQMNRDGELIVSANYGVTTPIELFTDFDEPIMARADIASDSVPLEEPVKTVIVRMNGLPFFHGGFGMRE